MIRIVEMLHETEQTQEHQPGKRYEDSLVRAWQNAKSFSLSDKENIKIMQDLNNGMEEFYRAERTMRAKTELELKTIILD